MERSHLSLHDSPPTAAIVSAGQAKNVEEKDGGCTGGRGFGHAAHDMLCNTGHDVQTQTRCIEDMRFVNRSHCEVLGSPCDTERCGWW